MPTRLPRCCRPSLALPTLHLSTLMCIRHPPVPPAPHVSPEDSSYPLLGAACLTHEGSLPFKKRWCVSEGHDLYSSDIHNPVILQQLRSASELLQHTNCVRGILGGRVPGWEQTNTSHTAYEAQRRRAAPCSPTQRFAFLWHMKRISMCSSGTKDPSMGRQTWGLASQPIFLR